MSIGVAVRAVPRYDLELIRSALREGASSFGGFEGILQGRRKVLLKPSVLRVAAPGEAVCTHPTVVEALCLELGSLGAEVVVGDSCGGVDYGRTKDAFAVSGIAAAAERAGATWLNFDEGGTDAVALAQGRHMRDFRVARALGEAEVVISVPKLKTHMEVQLTGAVKNMLGVIPGSGKLAVHKAAPKPRDLGHALLDVFLARPADFAVMDAIWAMEGAGPSRGRPRELGALLLSPSAPALDWVAARLVGLDPMRVATVAAAAERGLGPAGDEELDLRCEDFAAMIVPDFAKASTLIMELLPRWLLEVLNRRFFDVWLEVDATRCKRCGLCRRSCPVQAIDGGEGTEAARISVDRCVRCFCCHELCPHDALRIRKSVLVRLLSS